MPPPPTAPPTLSPMPGYKASSDKTLTSGQASSGGFRPAGTEKVVQAKPIDESEFRSPSNPTTSGHSSGYHESFLPTDAMRFLSRRKVNTDGTATMPAWSGNSVLPKYAGSTILEPNVRPVAEASDGARTDTAQTVLSVPGGKPAGHTGSGVKTTGQAAAHDFLRHQGMRTLQEPGVTSGVAGTVAGAMTVMSVAPGQIASTAQGAGNLKDVQARSSYEERRNDAKRKLGAYYQSLPPKEQNVVMKLAKQGMGDLKDSGRRLLPDRPHSPLRDPTGGTGAALSGGGYLPMPPVLTPTPPPSAFAPIPASSSSSSSSTSSAHQTPTIGTPVVTAPPRLATTTTTTTTVATATPPTTPSTAASGSGADARGIAMDITSSFRSDRK